MNRREFLVAGGAFAVRPLLSRAAGSADAQPVVRFGMVADSHYADIPDRWCGDDRCYRESLAKMTAAVKAFGELKCDFVIELGDLKDQTKGPQETLAALDAVESRLAAFKGDVFHVCGNHDFDCIRPEEFYAHIRNAGRKPDCGHYSFDRGGIRFIVLDACYTSDMKHYDRGNPWTDANVPPAELEWLKATLDAAKGPAVVFCHQLLDPAAARPGHLVKNHAAVREVLEKSGKVRNVITGHQHCGAQSVLNGISHYSLEAQVDGRGPKTNCYAVASVYADGSVAIDGYERAKPRPRDQSA